jgi:hypothetical protein
LERQVEVVTETASIAIFDPEMLAPRKDDRDDWYAIEREQLAELRRGRLVLLPVPHDGRFTVRFTWRACNAAERRHVVGENDRCWVEVSSGELYCTALENAPAGGRHASASREQVLNVPAGRYRLHCAALDLDHPENLSDMVIRLIALDPSARPPRPSEVPELWPRQPMTSPNLPAPTHPDGVHRLLEDGDAPFQLKYDATVVLFDPQALAHRASGSAAWIDDEREMMEEARAGHLAWAFTVQSMRPPGGEVIMRELHDLERGQLVASDDSGWIEAPSGRLLCGGAPDLPRRGHDPQSEIAAIIQVEPGRYRVRTHALRMDAENLAPRFVLQLIRLKDSEPDPPGPDELRDLYEDVG